MSQFKIDWIDLHREPQCKPDPNYPNGKDIRFLPPGTVKCIVELPYPAKRCGYYIIFCNDCKCRIAVTTAGRPDDPKSVEIGCIPSVNTDS